MHSSILFLLIFCSALAGTAQSTLPQSKADAERRISEIAFVREMMLRNPKTIVKSGQAKNLRLSDYQYHMIWDTASTSWDTTNRYTYYSQQLGAGIIEFQAYVERKTQNGFVSSDSIYLLLDSNANWFKQPFSSDYKVLEEVFRLDTVFNTYRLTNEFRQTINTNNDPIRSEFRFHGWSPGQNASSFITFDSTNYYYASNASMDYYIEYSYNFFGGGFSRDSSDVITDANRYPIRVSDYEAVTNMEERRYEIAFDVNYNVINRKFYTTDLFGQFFLASENRLNYTNSLLISDSTLNDSGQVEFLTNFSYTSFNEYDTISSYNFLSNPQGRLVGSWSYKYDTLNRITQEVYRYSFVNGTFTEGDRIDYTYPANSTAISEQARKSKMIRIYPNPAEDYISISTPNDIVLGAIRIRDIRGSLIMEFVQESHDQMIDISELPKGIFFIQIGKNEAYKFVKR